MASTFGFCVEESVKSKLSKGDTFTCPQFVTGETAYLSNLIHPGVGVCNYAVGLIGGIRWSVVEGGG